MSEWQAAHVSPNKPNNPDEPSKPGEPAKLVNLASLPSLPTLRTRSPRSGDFDYDMPVFGPPEVAAAARDLRNQQAAWCALPASERAVHLHQLADATLRERDAIAHALAADTGRWAESLMEVDGAVSAMRRWADQAPALLVPPPARASSVPHISTQQHLRPYSLVGIISPWNFPLLLSLIDAYPALMAGCAVLVKPSEVTPRFVPVMQRVLAQVPALAAVLRFVTGPGSTGAALIDQVDLLCFTGSVATGRQVAVAAAKAFIPVHLELGGKDAAIVCADADLPRAAQAICWGSMVNAGQSCMSLERAYVERAVFEPFVQNLAQRMRALTLNWPELKTGHIGPIISGAQVAIVKRHLVDAFARGAQAVVGGAVLEHGGGFWCQPTLLVGTTPDMAVVAEETFAAILAVMPFDTDDHAIALANSGVFGLSGCVFSSDLARAERIASQLHAGAISINDASLTAIVHDGAKQSFKSSGLGGSRMGTASLQRFYRQQVFLSSNGAASPWWFR